jgi:hypothetical protein
MIKKKMYNSKDIDQNALDMLGGAIIDNFKDGVPPTRYEISVSLTAADIRKGYVQGTIPYDVAEKYDLFKIKKTNIRYRMHEYSIENIIVEDHY